MEMTFIIILILFGVLFLVAELVLLPGVSIGAVLSLTCYGSAIYISFRDYGMATGAVVTLVVIVLSIAATILSLRAKTWQRFSLHQKVPSSSMTMPAEQNVKIGDRGVTLSRLSPMGKVEIGNQIFEAKSLDAYVDPKTTVEVVGFENFNIIVKTTK
ncbi:MAG: NfeD family protein [Alistipes sp.]